MGNIMTVLVPIVEWAWPHVAKQWEYYRDFNQNMGSLSVALEKLNSRKTDLETKLKNMLVPGETEVVEEVKLCLKRVEQIKGEVGRVEDEATQVKFFSRASLGRRVADMKPKVVELYEEGGAFAEGSLVRTLPRRGNEKPTVEKLGGQTTTEKTRDEIWECLVRMLPQRGNEKLTVEKLVGQTMTEDEILECLVRTLPRRVNEKPTVEKLGGQTTTEKTRDKILECLVNDNVTRIGVHGMGGIGKTTILEHVHNGLLKDGDEIGSKFDKVIWITVSKDCGLTGLQDKIARQLRLDISKDNDAERRATKLCREFKKFNNKRYVLILDDMWEAYRLKNVGIPNPTPENGFKLVLTTRSRDVCTNMECNTIIEMGVLLEEEARDLFLDKVGQNVASTPELHEIVGQVARECAGLPLAIVTVAGSLRDRMDMIEWEDALDDLKDATASMSREITAILRFSYDRLKDKNLKDCLLYCALYPEDWLIERNLLIDQLIAEEIVEEAKTGQSPARKGHIMLNNLLRSSLLIETKNHTSEKFVKLHDSTRDMAIQIMRESPWFVTEKREEIWNEHVERVSLMGTKIHFTKPPKCPRLSTLLLSRNYIQSLSEEFFLQLERLCVLDRSWNDIQTLPTSVSNLVNLVVLSLAYCQMLVHVPDLSELRNLRRLDLCFTRITEVPKGMEALEKLTYLDLSDTNLKSLPKGTLCKLWNLHFLSLITDGICVTTEELVNLRKLETLRVCFVTFKDLNAYVRSSNSGKLTNFYLQVGADECIPLDFNINNHVRLINCNINEWVEPKSCWSSG